LHGFLPVARLLNVLKTVPEFHRLQGLFENGGYSGLYRHVMTMPGEEVDAILAPLTTRILKEGRAGGLEKRSADYWTAKVVGDRGTNRYDRGVFSIYFLNLVSLRPGQAIFQDAGVPHAYLQGQNIEVMANSDNVLRGGLTEKHVDVPELLRIVRFEGIEPEVIEATFVDGHLEGFYESPAYDFRLSRMQFGEGDRYSSFAGSLEIVLLREGEAVLKGSRRRLSLARGQSAAIFAGTHYEITAMCEQTVLFRAAAPL
jgi:mannose-6-phosphate isomerase